VVAKRVTRAVKAGRFKVVVKFLTSTKNRLKKLGTTRMTLRIVVTPPNGPQVTISKVISLRR
jgi:hypothetical protein